MRAKAYCSRQRSHAESGLDTILAMLRLWMFVPLVLLCGDSCACADTLQLKDNAAISGNILSEKGDSVVVDVGYRCWSSRAAASRNSRAARGAGFGDLMAICFLIGWDERDKLSDGKVSARFEMVKAKGSFVPGADFVHVAKAGDFRQAQRRSILSVC